MSETQDTAEQTSEILRMMDSYRSTPLRDALRNSPFIMISAGLHLAFVFLATYITWEVQLPREDVVIQPKIENKFVPPPLIMISPKPQQARQNINKSDRIQDNVQISQTNLPMLDELLKKRNVQKGPSLLVTPGDSPVLVGEVGGEGLRLSGGAGNAAKDVVDWGEWSKGRILVVWLFDESISMKDDQQEIRDRVDEVYNKLELLAGLRGSSMKVVTTVASYGKDAHILIKDPTDKVKEVRQAIDRVPVDESGEENYLRAISTVLDVFEPYARTYKRRIVIILVTDEGGDDDDAAKLGADSPLEQTIARLKATDASVLVFGMMGGFYCQGTSENEPGIGIVNVNRGRDTGTNDLLPGDYPFVAWGFIYGGFGPYAYTRIAHETGGMLFLLNTMASTYDYEKLLDGYQPEVVSRQELLVRDGKNPLRTAIRQCIMDWEEMRRQNPINLWMSKEAVDTMTTQAEKGFRQIIEFCNAWIPRLESVGNTIVPDSPKRWEADREAIVAQLHQRRYIARRCLVALSNLRQHRNIPPAGDNGWYVGVSNGVLPNEPEAEQELVQVKAKWQEIVDKQAGTPWATYARREMYYLGEVLVFPAGRWSGKGTPKG